MLLYWGMQGLLLLEAQVQHND